MHEFPATYPMAWVGQPTDDIFYLRPKCQKNLSLC